jgi:Ribbon-helix-helix protein, copG family
MKTEVYSWRLSPDLKADLEHAAREEGVSVSRLLERIAREWLKARPGAADDEAEQERIRASAMRFIGKLRGDDPDRSANVSERVRDILTERHARSQRS